MPDGEGLEPPKKRGFAALPLEERRRIARKGSKAAQQKGTGHRWTSETAQEAAGSAGASRLRTNRNRSSKKPAGYKATKKEIQ